MTGQKKWWESTTIVSGLIGGLNTAVILLKIEITTEEIQTAVQAIIALATVVGVYLGRKKAAKVIK
tara:strand:- start:3875 stop:4072 length:198 start_codon:yes stop_codon:yes gene_type:complete